MLIYLAAPPKPSPEGRALKHFQKVSPTGGDLEGAFFDVLLISLAFDNV